MVDPVVLSLILSIKYFIFYKIWWHRWGRHKKDRNKWHD